MRLMNCRSAPALSGANLWGAQQPNIQPAPPNGWYAPNPFPPPPGAVVMPHNPPLIGCICPPGANKDCEAPMCPRQNHLKSKPE